MSKSVHIDIECPMNLTLNILSGKWKIAILWQLTKGPIRFNELQRCLTHITQKTLTQQLRELEQDGMIIRKVYPEIPPKVEYGFSYLGETIMPILDAMCQWGKDYQKSHSRIS